MPYHEYTLDTADHVSLFAREWAPDGEPSAVVCLVHGLGEHSGRYAQVGEAFNRAGYALLAFDLRGHGRSPGPRGHVDRYAVALDDIACHLADAAYRYPERPCVLYGHSLGGNLVLNYALRHRPPIAGVISTSPLLRPTFPIPRGKLLLAQVLAAICPRCTLATGIDAAALSRDPSVVRAYVQDPLSHNRAGVRFSLEFLAAGEWALAHAADFPLPLLLAHGTADRVTSFAASQAFARQAGPRCTWQPWNGLYHETHNEPEKAQVIAFTLGWLSVLLHNQHPDQMDGMDESL